MKAISVALGVMLALPSISNAAEYVVKMRFNEETGAVFFEPRRLEINLGDSVTWVQEDAANPHNVVSYPDGIPKDASLFMSPMMKCKGENWSMRFTERGTYKYHCHPHEEVGMKGLVIVERESRPDEVRRAGADEHGHGPDDAGDEKKGHGMKKGDHHGEKQGRE